MLANLHRNLQQAITTLLTVLCLHIQNENKTYVTGSAKTRHNSAFSNYILLHFYNVQTQMYVLAKFQLRILKSFEVSALQSSSNRKINLYSKYRENKLQVLPKTDVTYE